MEQQSASRTRPDLVCLSLGQESLHKAKILAKSEGRSVSSFLRELIKKIYKKNKSELAKEDLGQ